MGWLIMTAYLVIAYTIFVVGLRVRSGEAGWEDQEDRFDIIFQVAAIALFWAVALAIATIAGIGYGLYRLALVGSKPRRWELYNPDQTNEEKDFR